MSSKRESLPGAFVVLVVFALCGCERGCLSRWLGDRGVGGASPGGGGSTAPPPSLTLEGTDCSDGLLRCVDGRLEASRAAHLPHPCGGDKSGEARRAACECPWDVIARCPGACAMDGLEVIGIASDAGTAQLCRPDMPVARPVVPADPLPAEICTGRHVTCVDGIVRYCAGAGRIVEALAVCLHGCQSHVAFDTSGAELDAPGAPKNRDGVASILCRHDHAERR